MDDLFIVVFDEDVPRSIMERAEVLADRVHKLADNVLLISFPDLTTQGLVRVLVPDYDQNDPATMAVFELNGSYSGYYYKSLWNWLRETRNRAVHS